MSTRRGFLLSIKTLPQQPASNRKNKGSRDLTMATRFDRFTIKAQEALQATQDVAGKFGNQQLEPVHLLLALLEQPEGIVPTILSRLGATPAAVAQETESHGKLCNLFGVPFQVLVDTVESPATTAYGAYLIDVALRVSSTITNLLPFSLRHHPG